MKKTLSVVFEISSFVSDPASPACLNNDFSLVFPLLMKCAAEDFLSGIFLKCALNTEKMRTPFLK